MRSIRIFISSPGDVSEEREKARLVVESLQRLYGNEIRLEILMWEDLALDIDLSAQQSIEKELVPEEKVPDIAVFILWNRLGSELSEERTPRPGGGSYRSGTEHEFELMLGARAKNGNAKPHILAYWRQDEEGFVELLRREGPGRYEQMLEQKRLARHFIEERFLDEKGRNVRGLVIYQKPVSFAERLHRHLQQKIGEWLGSEGRAAARWKENPYRGLECFDQEHSPIFLGREEETHQLIELLRMREKNGNAFVAVVGASGTGKSSLARAGVAATLSRGSFDEKVMEWRSRDFLPSAHEGELFPDFASTLAEVLPELRLGAGGLDRFVERLGGNPEAAADLLASALGRASESAGGAVRLLLLVDQMEELWTDPRIGEELRERFFEALRFLSLAGGVWVLATLRADFYPEAQKSPAFLRLKGIGGHFDLPPPGPAALLRIIIEPAKLAGAHFETDPRSGLSLDQAILKDASSEAESLPLLQYALAELFEKRDVLKNELTFSAYQSMGGVEGALGRRIEDLCADLPGGTLAGLEAIFPLLVTLDATSGGSEARRRATMKELSGADETKFIVEALVKARFLTTDEVNGEAVASLAHEALLRCWGRLAEWIERNRVLLRLRTTVEQSHSRWLQHDRDPSLLLGDGLASEEGRTLLAEGAHLLSADLSSFIRESIQQIERRTKRRSILRRQMIAGIVGTLCLGLVASTWQAVRATRAERVTEILERASRARVLAESSPVEALALALETSEHEQRSRGVVSPAVLSSLLHTLESGRRLAQFGNTGDALQDCLLSHDGRLIVYANRLRITTVDRRSGLSRRSEPTRGATIRRLALSPDGQLLAIADDTGSITVVRTSGHEVFWRAKAHDGYATGLAWIPESNLIASCGNDRRLRLWSVDGKEVGDPVALPVDSVGTFAVSPDGRSAAVAASEVHAGQGAWVIDLFSGEAKPLEAGDDFIRVLAFDSSGKHIAGAGVDRTIRVWDGTGSPVGIRIRTSHNSSITALAFHPFEPWLMSGAEDGGVHVYREDGEFHMPPLERHLGPVRRLGFDASGAFGISGSRDGVLRIWDLLGLQASPPLHAGSLCRGLVFHPDGTKLAAGGLDGLIRFYSYPSGESLARVRAHNNLSDLLLPLPAVGGLLSASDEGNELQLLSWEGELVGEPWRPPGARHVAVSVFPDRPELLVLDADGILFHVELPTFRILSQERIATREDVQGDNLTLETFPEHLIFLYRGGNTLESRSLDDPTKLIQRLGDLRPSGNMRFRLAFPPSRDLLVTGGQKARGQNRLELHSLPQFDRVGELEVPWLNLTLAAFGRDGNELVIGSETGEMQIFARRGEALGPEIKAHAGEVRGGALHPRESILATSGLDGYIRFWHFGREAWMEEARSRLGRGRMEFVEPPGLLQRAASQFLTESPSDGTGRLREEEIGISLVQPKEWVQFDRNALKMFQSLVVTTGGVTFQRMRIHRAFTRGDSVRLGLLDVPNFYLISTNEFGGIENLASQVPRMMERVGGMVSSQTNALALAERIQFSDTVWDEELRAFRVEGVVERKGRDPIQVGIWVVPTKNHLVAVVTAGDQVLLNQVGEIVRTIEVDPSMAPSEEEYSRAGEWLRIAYEEQRKRDAIRLEADSALLRLREDQTLAKSHTDSGRFDEALAIYRKNVELVENLTKGPKAGEIQASKLMDLLFRLSEIHRRMAEIGIRTGDTKSAALALERAMHLFERPGLDLPPAQRRAREMDVALLEHLTARVKDGEEDQGGAIEWERKAVERRRALAAAGESSDVQAVIELMANLLYLAGYQRKAGDDSGALANCEEAIRIGSGVEESLRSESWLTKMRELLAVARLIHRDRNAREAELEALRQRVEVGVEWAERHEPSRATRWADAACRLEFANLLLEGDEDRLAEAEAETKVALDLIAALMPEETDPLRIDGSALSGLGTIQDRLRKKRSEMGLEALRQVIAMRERLEELRGLPEQIDKSSFSGWITLGSALFDFGRVSEADATFEEGLTRAKASGNPAILFDCHYRLRGHFESRADFARAETHARIAWETAREEGLGWQLVQGATGLTGRLYNSQRFTEAEELALETWKLAESRSWPGEPHRLRIDLANNLRELYRRWYLAQGDEAHAAAALTWAQTAFEHSSMDEKLTDQNLDSALGDRLWRLATWVEEGRIGDYEAELDRVLALARDRKHLLLSGKAARLALLRPCEGERLAEAVRMARFSFDGTGAADSGFWEFITQALALVRSGKAEEALSLLDGRKKDRSGDNPTAIRVVRLLALNSLGGRAEQAKAILSEIEADEGQKKFWSSPGESYGAFVRVLIAEAKGGIEPDLENSPSRPGASPAGE